MWLECVAGESSGEVNCIFQLWGKTHSLGATQRSWNFLRPRVPDCTLLLCLHLQATDSAADQWHTFNEKAIVLCFGYIFFLILWHLSVHYQKVPKSDTELVLGAREFSFPFPIFSLCTVQGSTIYALFSKPTGQVGAPVHHPCPCLGVWMLWSA